MAGDCELASVSLAAEDFRFTEANTDFAHLAYVALEFPPDRRPTSTAGSPAFVSLPGDETAQRANSFTFTAPARGMIVHAFKNAREADDVASALVRDGNLQEVGVTVHRASVEE